MACIWCVLNARSCVGCVLNATVCIGCVLNTTVCVGCVPRLEATALAPESSVYILYALYLGTHGTKNIFLLMYIWPGGPLAQCMGPGGPLARYMGPGWPLTRSLGPGARSLWHRCATPSSGLWTPPLSSLDSGLVVFGPDVSTPLNELLLRPLGALSPTYLLITAEVQLRRNSLSR